jgi:hypothetical protein
MQLPTLNFHKGPKKRKISGDMLTLSRQVGSKTSVNTHHAGEEDLMTLQLGAVAPDFEAEITQRRIRFHEWIGEAWCLLFSHPKDFTPVCTTELGCMARIIDPAWENLNYAA